MRYALSLILLLCLSAGLPASEIKFKGVELYQSEDKIMLDLAQQYTLNETVLEALESSVPITFETRVGMERDDGFFWQRDIADLRLLSELSYHPLASEYQVHKLYNGEKMIFATLSAALEALGLMRSLEIIAVSELDAEAYYMVGIQTQLDIGSLPLPLRPLAYLSPSWHLQSKVWEWRLQP